MGKGDRVQMGKADALREIGPDLLHDLRRLGGGLSTLEAHLAEMKAEAERLEQEAWRIKWGVDELLKRLACEEAELMDRPTIEDLFGEEGRDWTPCVECGAPTPMPEQALVCQGDYWAPPVYDWAEPFAVCPNGHRVAL